MPQWPSRDACPRRREGSSCDGQDLVTDQVEANSLGSGLVEKERCRRLKHVLAQLLPRIPLSEDVFGKALSAESAVGFLDDFEHQFCHTHYDTAWDLSGPVHQSPQVGLATVMGRTVAKLTSNAQIVKSDGCPLHSWCEIPTQPAVAGIGGQSPDSPVLRIIHRDRSWLSPLHVNRAQTPDAEKGGIPGPWPRGLLRISYAAWRSTPGPWAPGFILRQCLVFGLFSVVGKDPLYLALIPSVWKYVLAH